MFFFIKSLLIFLVAFLVSTTGVLYGLGGQIAQQSHAELIIYILNSAFWFLSFAVISYLFLFFKVNCPRCNVRGHDKHKHIKTRSLFVFVSFLATLLFVKSLPSMLWGAMIFPMAVLIAIALGSGAGRLVSLGLPLFLAVPILYIGFLQVMKQEELPPEDAPLMDYPRNKLDFSLLLVAGYVLFGLAYCLLGFFAGGFQGALTALQPWSARFAFFVFLAILMRGLFFQRRVLGFAQLTLLFSMSSLLMISLIRQPFGDSEMRLSLFFLNLGKLNLGETSGRLGLSLVAYVLAMFSSLYLYILHSAILSFGAEVPRAEVAHPIVSNDAFAPFHSEPADVELPTVLSSAPSEKTQLGTTQKLPENEHRVAQTARQEQKREEFVISPRYFFTQNQLARFSDGDLPRLRELIRQELTLKTAQAFATECDRICQIIDRKNGVSIDWSESVPGKRCHQFLTDFYNAKSKNIAER